MTRPCKLFFIAHVHGGENVDLVVAALDVGAATHHWRRYFGRTDPPDHDLGGTPRAVSQARASWLANTHHARRPSRSRHPLTMKVHPMRSDKSVTLTRKQIATILEDMMGWESIDTRSFWRLAQKEDATPGALDRELRETTERISKRMRRAFANAKATN